MKQTAKTWIIGLVSGIIGAIIVVAIVAGIFLTTSGFNFGTKVSDDNLSGAPKGSAQITNKTVTETTPATKAFNKVNKSVVSVINLKDASNSTSSLARLFGEDQKSSKSSKNEYEEYGEGSGLIYSKQGKTSYIVTNNHVVAGSDKVEVLLSNGKKESAKIKGRDATSDLAVLEIPSNNVEQVGEFADSDAISAGQTVLAVGSPLGKEFATSVTEGIISAKDREVNIPVEGKKYTQAATVLQTDAAINPGNSGGPLINVDGQVVGINSMKLSSNTDGTSVEGMGFAIPSNEVVKIINELVKNGKVVRPTLGITAINVADVSRDVLNKIGDSEDLQNGVIVASTVDGGPAKNAGIRNYDVITKIDGKEVKTTNDMHAMLNDKKINQKIKVTILRNNKATTKEVTLKETRN